MLRSRISRKAGFTLIEMVVTMTIFALLVALTVPTMRTWVAAAKVRAVADSLQNGLRLAQTEALRRGRQVVFALTTTATPLPGFTASATGNYWAAQTIPADPSEAPVIVGSGPVTFSGSPITVAGPGLALCFNSVGRLVTQVATGVVSDGTDGGSVCIAPYVTIGGVAMWTFVVSQPLADHPITVEVARGGQIHLCDPTQTLSPTNPYGC